jgi:CRP-like cAMP-binding protein
MHANECAKRQGSMIRKSIHPHQQQHCTACAAPCVFMQDLEGGTCFGELERALLHRADMPANTEILAQGEASDNFFMVAKGWVCLYVLLEDGRRQNIGFALPGDMVGFSFDPVEEMGFSAETLGDSTLCVGSKERALAILPECPMALMRLSRQIWWEHHHTRSLLTSVARTNAIERVAYLLYTLYLRATREEAARGDCLQVPLTQQQIGDAVGLTSVHVSRMLSHLRSSDLLSLRGGRLRILDPRGLAELANLDVDTFLQQLNAAEPPRQVNVAEFLEQAGTA